MTDEIRVTRPTPSPSVMQSEPASTSSPSRAPWLVLGVIVALLIILGVVFRGQLFGKKKDDNKSQAGTTTTYQAVFLTNGQVYFGKLSDIGQDYLTMTDIYYLQVGPNQGSGAATTSPGQEIHLVKLGQELHGPVDQMHISRQQILFYEDLKPDGQVVTAINKDKAGTAK